MLPKCERHRQPAGWKCRGCRRVLCPDCVAVKRVQMATELDVCLVCGELAEPLTVHRSEQRSFARRIPGALIWPLSKAGLIALVAVALVRAMASYFVGLGSLLGAAVFAAVCFGFIRSTARGSDDFDGFDYGDMMADVMLPGLKALVGAAIVWVPAALWIGSRHHPLQNPGGMLLDPVVWLLLACGIAYAPMAILVGASGESLLGMLNPVYVARHALRLGADYFIAVVTLCVLVVPWLLSLAVGEMVNLVPIPFVPRVLGFVIGCYVPFVAARVLGLLLFTRGDAIGYGLDADYRVPLLAGVGPRGVLPETQEPEHPTRQRHAAIELEPEPAAVEFDAPVEAPRPRVTELDPAALPPLKVEPED